MVQVRTTLRPWEPVEVDQREYEALYNQNLLVEDEAPPEPRLPDRVQVLKEQNEERAAEVQDSDASQTQAEKNEQQDKATSKAKSTKSDDKNE
jgi:hypothetical protein